MGGATIIIIKRHSIPYYNSLTVPAFPNKGERVCVCVCEGDIL